MMHSRWLWLVAAVALGCTPPGTAVQPDETPAWLKQLIARLESEPVANPPASIVQYQYQGAMVYYLPPRCCDIPGTLFSAKGEVVCQPDGGMTGDGDGKCGDFFDLAKQDRVVWRDGRGSK